MDDYRSILLSKVLLLQFLALLFAGALTTAPALGMPRAYLPALTDRAGLVPVMFGDGDPANGIEDDRELLVKAHGLATKTPQAVGVILCRYIEDIKGQRKTIYRTSTGTLVRIDTKEGYDVLVTAAHAFFRPDTNTEIDICHFHPGGKKKPRIKLHRKYRIYGFNDPKQRSRRNDFAVVRINRKFSKVYGALEWARMSEREYLELSNRGLVLEFIAFNREKRMLSVSRHDCRISPKGPGDYYYGIDSIYLHSCDGTHGSSGGALIANIDGKSLLVGIQSAININRRTYPYKEYRKTNGIPAGAKFDPSNYTGVALNFLNYKLWNTLRDMENGDLH